MTRNEVQTIDHIISLQDTIIRLEELKYKMALESEYCEDIARDIEYEVLAELRKIHSCLMEFRRNSL